MDMKLLSPFRARYVAVIAPLVLIASCSSGGGGKDAAEFGADVARCILTIGLDCPREDAPSADQTNPTTSTFTSWTDLPRDVAFTFQNSSGFSFDYSSNQATGDTTGGFFTGVPAQVHYDSQGRAVTLNMGSGLNRAIRPPVATLSAIGLPWLDYAVSSQPAPGAPFFLPLSPFFTSLSTVYDIDIVANPYALGWNYQTFGVWDGAPADYRSFGGRSFGAPTPASAVPTSGSATFTGKLAGFYMASSGVGSLAAADIRVLADFNNRSLNFSSANTTVTRDLSTTTSAANLNLSGTLFFGTQSDQFAGTLTNSGGTMSGTSRGRFYGPGAQELGGAFGLQSQDGTEKFSGAYGAKR